MLSTAYANRQVAPGSAFVVTPLKTTGMFPVLSNGNFFFLASAKVMLNQSLEYHCQIF